MFQYAMGRSLSLELGVPIFYSDTLDQYDYNFPKIRHFPRRHKVRQIGRETNNPLMGHSFVRRASGKLCNVLGKQVIPKCTFDLHRGYSPIKMRSNIDVHYSWHLATRELLDF